MSISALLLQDFKCFKELELPCAPLTVLTGYNAAGKSTALHALLLMAQALRSNPISNRLALNGDLVSLGTAGDVIRNGAESQGICLGAKAADEQIRWTFEYDRTLSARGVMALKSAEYDSPLRSETSASQMVPGPNASDSDLLRVLQETVFVGPGRMTQLSTYPVPRSSWQAPGNVGMSGEYAAYWYLECADEEVDPGRRHQRERDARTVRSQIEAWLDEFFPGARVGANRLSPESPVHLAFRLQGTGGWVPPANVGYGLGYAFPMLVTMLTAELGSVVVIDSAEAHLHPRAQSAVGHFLGQMAGAGLQILVETHSDHLLNGIRLAVRDSLVKPHDVALHFFDAGDATGQVTSLTIDDNGAIGDWPEGFFDQAERDLAILSGWA